MFIVFGRGHGKVYLKLQSKCGSKFTCPYDPFQRCTLLVEGTINDKERKKLIASPVPSLDWEKRENKLKCVWKISPSRVLFAAHSGHLI